MFGWMKRLHERISFKQRGYGTSKLILLKQISPDDDVYYRRWNNGLYGKVNDTQHSLLTYDANYVYKLRPELFDPDELVLPDSVRRIDLDGTAVSRSFGGEYLQRCQEDGNEVVAAG